MARNTIQDAVVTVPDIEAISAGCESQHRSSAEQREATGHVKQNHLEAKDCKDEGIACVVTEGIARPQQAFLHQPHNDIARAAHARYLLPALLSLCSVRKHLSRPHAAPLSTIHSVAQSNADVSPSLMHQRHL